MLTIQQAQEFFTEVQPDQIWNCKQTNITIGHGILQYYRTCTNKDLNGLSQYGLPTNPEQRVPNTKQAVMQRMERGVICYDPLNEVDRVPGISSTCYAAHIDKGPGRDPSIAQLLTENSQLVNEVAQLKQQLAQHIPPTISTDKQ